MKVSVITPIYKGQRYIKGLIDMVARNSRVLEDKLEQRGVQGQCELELILVNDSPDQQLTIQSGDKLVDSRITVRIIVNDQNRGIHYSRVHGLKESTGDYVIFLDQDDKLVDHAVYRFLQESRKQKDADVLIANGTRTYADREDILYSKDRIMQKLGKEYFYLYGTDLIFSPGQCMIRKAAIPEEWMTRILAVNGCDDMLLWLLMLNQNRMFIGIKEILYHHMETDENFSNSFRAMQNSFSAMCDLLQQNEHYPAKKIAILRRRIHLKEIIKQGHAAEKLRCMLRNIDVLIITFYYKLCGYH